MLRISQLFLWHNITWSSFIYIYIFTRLSGLCFKWLWHDFLIGTLTQPNNGSAAFNTFENGRRKMSLGIFNTLAGLSFDKSSGSDSSRRSSSPDVSVYDQVKHAVHEWLFLLKLNFRFSFCVFQLFTLRVTLRILMGNNGSFYHFQKHQTSVEDDFAGNYFKPKRATELLIQSHEESGRPFHKWKGTRILNNIIRTYIFSTFKKINFYTFISLKNNISII